VPYVGHLYAYDLALLKIIKLKKVDMVKVTKQMSAVGRAFKWHRSRQ
jgi:hypothetical protein